MNTPVTTTTLIQTMNTKENTNETSKNSPCQTSKNSSVPIGMTAWTSTELLKSINPACFMQVGKNYNKKDLQSPF